MKILVLSDLHLGQISFSAIHEGQRIDKDADVVVLAGDIDDGVKGFHWGRETFPDKPIVMVSGNHEFYDCHFVTHLDSMREAARKYHIDFLETDVVDLAGVRFLGCTLWTDFCLFGPERKSDAFRLSKITMSDYGYIKSTRTPEQHWARTGWLIPEQTELRHVGSVDWLSKQLSSGREPARTVVVTHHAPHPRSVPNRFAADVLSAAYASDLTRLMGRATLWIHGHMHNSADYVVEGTRVVCNPRGYPGYLGGVENAFFAPGLIVEI